MKKNTPLAKIFAGILSFFRNLDSYGRINLWSAASLILALGAWQLAPREVVTVKAINAVLEETGETWRVGKQVKAFGWRVQLSAAGAACYTVVSAKNPEQEEKRLFAVTFSTPKGGMFTLNMALVSAEGEVKQFTQLSETTSGAMSPAEQEAWRRRASKIAVQAFDVCEARRRSGK